MLSAWLLPEHIADVLPPQARHIEQLRRRLLDLAQRYGFELVIPPLVEHLDALLSGTGQALDLATFKLVDQASGRLLGVRADTTPQAARIDAHLLNRDGITRLCYCGPVLHTRPAGVAATREPLQFGAEIFGHGGLEADLEAAELALDALAAAGIDAVVIDLADARVLRGVLAGLPLDAVALHELVDALAAKDGAAVGELGASLPGATRAALRELLHLYGGEEVIERARCALPERALVRTALDELQWLAARLRQSQPGLRVGFDLADMSGYAYYSGLRFALYAAGGGDALARGGRYDEVGSVFGRNRPAVGFSLDLKALSEAAAPCTTAAAVRAPWADDPALRAAVRRLRESGETVVSLPPGLPSDTQAYGCDRELVAVEGRWFVRAAAVQPNAAS